MVDHVLVEPGSLPRARCASVRVAWMAGFVFRRAHVHGGTFVPTPCASPHAAARASSVRELFGVDPIRCDRDQPDVSRSILALPFPSADPTLRNVLALRAQAALDALPQLTDVHGNVKSAVRARLREGDASLAAGRARAEHGAAYAAGTPARRRHLLSRSVDESRMELAFEYLERGELRVADIAHSLGFESPSAFARWYRRRDRACAHPTSASSSTDDLQRAAMPTSPRLVRACTVQRGV